MTDKDRTLIFVGIEFVHPECINRLEENYPDLVSQRTEIESKSNWPDKEVNSIDLSNRYTMLRKICNDKKVLHVHIPLYSFDHNDIANILLKVSKNRKKLGNLFSIHNTHRLNNTKFETIISEISLNERMDTLVLH